MPIRASLTKVCNERKHITDLLENHSGKSKFICPQRCHQNEVINFCRGSAHKTTRDNDETKKRKRKREWSFKTALSVLFSYQNQQGFWWLCNLSGKGQ